MTAAPKVQRAVVQGSVVVVGGIVVVVVVTVLPVSVVVVVPKVASRLPSGLYRASANWVNPPVPEAPAATIFPSRCSARALAESLCSLESVLTIVVTVPPVPKVASRLPSGL